MFDYVVDALREPIQSLVGWTVVILVTVVAGLWVGIWIGTGELPSLKIAFQALIFAPVAWLLFPRILVAFGITALAWYLPLRLESSWLGAAAALVNLIACLLVTASVFASIS